MCEGRGIWQPRQNQAGGGGGGGGGGYLPAQVYRAELLFMTSF